MDEIREACGVVAISSKNKEEIPYLMYNGLLAIQHRGQNACGYSILEKEKIKRKVGLGLVPGVLNKDDMKVKGTIAIGHTRYPTTGRCKIEDVQPIQYNDISLAHNGHISNYWDLRKDLENKGYEFKATVDSEVLLYLLHYELKNGKTIEEAVATIMKKVVGAYSVVGIVNKKLVVFRDPHAIRPLILGKRGNDICFGSESVVLDINNFEYNDEVKGGELIIINNGKMERKIIMEKEKKNCMFEYVYFSRPDSIINNILVNNIRKKLGEILAEEHPVEADVVIPVPDTSRTAALSFSEKLKINYEEGIIKNRYIGRTFIMMTQEERKVAVRRKVNPIKEVVNGKRVILVDDSIVRGTTMKEIIKMVKKAGAKEVHLRITCPPIKAPCFYGIDMPTYSELIANNKTIKEIEKYLNVESLGYLPIEGLKKAIGEDICTGCLNEEYFSEYVKKMAEKEKKGEGVKRGCGEC